MYAVFFLEFEFTEMQPYPNRGKTGEISKGEDTVNLDLRQAI